MRILLLNTAYPPPMIGGAEKAVSLLASGLVQLGHTVHVVAKHNHKEVSRQTVEDVVVTRLPVDNLYWPFSDKPQSSVRRALWHLIEMWNLKTAHRVGQLMDEIQPDVFHTQNHSCFSVAVWAQARRRGIRIVHTMHDYSLFCSRSTAFHHNRTCRSQCVDCRFFSILRKRQSSTVDHAIAVSARTLALHREQGYFLNTPATVIHNIYDLHPDSVDHAGPTSGHQVLRFGFIGRVTPEKGIETLLNAVSRLASRDWRLRIAGIGNREYLQALQERFPDANIEWLGYVPAQQFYKSIDVVLIPSLWEEPMPYIAVEALANGKPIIASRAGGIAEAADRAPIRASFTPGDIAGLTAALQEALHDRARWGTAYTLPHHVLSDFHASSVVQSHLNIYRASGKQTG